MFHSSYRQDTIRKHSLRSQMQRVLSHSLSPILRERTSKISCKCFLNTYIIELVVVTGITWLRVRIPICRNYTRSFVRQTLCLCKINKIGRGCYHLLLDLQCYIAWADKSCKLPTILFSQFLVSLLC